MLYLYPMAFNRDRNNRGGGFRPRPSFGGRPRFGGREDREPVEMHSAVCDNCGKNCEVPFRPTSGKPVYCSDCFENQRGGTDSRRPNGLAEINAKLDNILRLLENQKPLIASAKED